MHRLSESLLNPVLLLFIFLLYFRQAPSPLVREESPVPVVSKRTALRMKLGTRSPQWNTECDLLAPWSKSGFDGTGMLLELACRLSDPMLEVDLCGPLSPSILRSLDASLL
ncbi:hypothetical protein C8R44DRAFT_742017 [Mycena epipterygia]|nr:hypothetical protein C8R44DRAFT_742017 [Mycena epipterygia]